MSQVYLVRQPIYNHRLQVIAYDLLFRSEQGSAVDSDWLLQFLQQVGLASLVGNRFVFFPLTASQLQSPETFPLSSSKVFLWVPDLHVSSHSGDDLLAYADHDFQCVIDLESVDKLDGPVLDRLAMVRVDLKKHPLEALRETLYALPGHGLKMLATPVDDFTAYDLSTKAGCRFFQGNFFLQAKVVQGQQMPPGRLSMLRILAQLQASDTDLKEIEQIIEQDVSLSYRLLRHLNSPYFGLLRKVQSIRHAVVYLGLKNLRLWASVLLLTKIEGKPQELMKIGLVRGKMCELLAPLQPGTDSDAFFTVGLLSTLDVLLDSPMEAILAELPLSMEIKQALTDGTGAAGEALTCAIDYENGRWKSVDASPFGGAPAFQAYLEAVRWGEESHGLLTAG